MMKLCTKEQELAKIGACGSPPPLFFFFPLQTSTVWERRKGCLVYGHSSLLVMILFDVWYTGDVHALATPLLIELLLPVYEGVVTPMQTCPLTEKFGFSLSISESPRGLEVDRICVFFFPPVALFLSVMQIQNWQYTPTTLSSFSWHSQ